jgi:putative nucleotidyltransferase with HDIG domain
MERVPTRSLSISEELAKLPTQPVAALRILKMVDDPRASAAALGRLVEIDPGLSTKVMRLANAPYYGLSGKVASAAQAVVLLGFSTVRALTASATAGLLVDDQPSGPAGFWTHAVMTACGAAAVARRVGGNPANAFTGGLLHDIGGALLHRIDPDGYEQARQAATAGQPIVSAEREILDMDHASVGQQVLREWQFPPALVRAIGDHHESLETIRDGLTRVVVAGEALAAACDESGVPAEEPAYDATVAVEALGLPASAARPLIAEVRREVAALAGFLKELE